MNNYPRKSSTTITEITCLILIATMLGGIAYTVLNGCWDIAVMTINSEVMTAFVR